MLLDKPGLENLRVGEAKKPQPGPSQVLVRVEAAYEAVGDARAKARLRTMLDELLAMVADGRLDALVAETITLEEVPENLERLGGRGKVAGKIVVRLKFRGLYARNPE